MSDSPHPNLQPMQPPPLVVLPADLSQAAIENLRAAGPHPQLAAKLHTFGQFVGVWDMDVKFFNEAGQIVYHQPNIWMFSWVLDGKAIQDVLAGPPRDSGANGRRVGSTLRYYDVALDTWKIVYISPSSQYFNLLEGGPTEDGIELKGSEPGGVSIRWVFSEITANTFRWQGFTSLDGQRWRKEQEMFASRRS